MTAGLKLFVLQKFNTSPKLAFATLMSNQRVVLVSADQGDRNATHAEPTARDGAGCRINAVWAAEDDREAVRLANASAPGGPPTGPVETVPSVAAEAHA